MRSATHWRVSGSLRDASRIADLIAAQRLIAARSQAEQHLASARMPDSLGTQLVDAVRVALVSMDSDAIAAAERHVRAEIERVRRKKLGTSAPARVKPAQPVNVCRAPVVPVASVIMPVATVGPIVPASMDISGMSMMSVAPPKPARPSLTSLLRPKIELMVELADAL